MSEVLDGPRLYQALAVRSGLRALQKGFKLNRAYTSTNCRRTAGNITGKKYPAGKKGIQQAIDDLTVRIDAAKCVNGSQVTRNDLDAIGA
jgi:hypothetical protein